MLGIAGMEDVAGEEEEMTLVRGTGANSQRILFPCESWGFSHMVYGAA